MNSCFRDPVIEAQPNSAHGDNTTLTSFEQKLIERYKTIEADAAGAHPDYPSVIAIWGKDKRDEAVSIAQKVVDGDFKSAGDIDNLRFAVVSALRPFVEE